MAPENEPLDRPEAATSSRRRRSRRPVLGVVLAAAALVGAAAAGAEAFPRSHASLSLSAVGTKSTAYPHCPAKTGEGAFDPKLSSSSESSDSTGVSTAPLPPAEIRVTGG
jgi:hypothetical protein